MPTPEATTKARVLAHDQLRPELELDGVVSQPLFASSQSIITHEASAQTSIFVRPENCFASRFLKDPAAQQVEPGGLS